VTAEGKPVNLATFSGTRPTKKGITFRVFRSGGRHLLKHAFLGKMKTKTGTYKTAFWRDWDKFRTQRRPGTFSKAKKHKKYRLPVTPREGPRVEDIYGRPAVMGAVLRKMDIRLEKNLDHELKHFLNNLFFE